VTAYLHGVDVLVGAHVTVAEDLETIATRIVAEVEAAHPVVSLTVLKSEIPGVSDEAWTEFAHAMRTADLKTVSSSGALGMFGLKQRRLADLGLMKNVTPANTRTTGKMQWKGEWVPPLTEKKFLASAVEQYKAFGASMRQYIEGLSDGSVKQPEEGLPADMTMSGVLAVLHRCGPSGLATWMDVEDRFPQTVTLFSNANGIF
jgi:hypothetical protein